MNYEHLIFNFLMPFVLGICGTVRFIDFKRNRENHKEALSLVREVEGIEKLKL